MDVMNPSRIRAQYRRWKLFYAELLAMNDIELAGEKAKALFHLNVLQGCMEKAGIPREEVS